MHKCSAAWFEYKNIELCGMHTVDKVALKQNLITPL